MTLRQTATRLALAAVASFGLAGAAQAYEAAAATDLNMRSGPGTQYRVVDTIPRGQIVDVADCSGSWCRVNFDGLGGWASANYLRDAGYAPRRTYREPVVVERPIIVERPVIVERPIVVQRGRRVVRQAPVYVPDNNEYRYHPYNDRRALTPGPNGSAVSFGVSIGNRPIDNDRFCYRVAGGQVVCE